MSLRITQNSMNRSQLAGLNESLSRLQRTHEELTTGKRLNRPSDDPVATVSAMRFRAEQGQLEQAGLNIADGLDRLRSADSTLSQTQNLIQRMRTLTVGSLSGTNAGAGREAVAKEIRELRGAIIQQANGGYAGQPLFGGTTTQTNAFDPDTGAFVGNENGVIRVISNAPGAAGQLDVGVKGQTMFGTDLEKGTGAIDSLAAAIQSGDEAGMKAGLEALDNLRGRVLDEHTTIGAKVNRLERQTEINGRQSDASKIALSKVEDTDFLKAAMDLSIQSNAYQAALSASAKVIQPSLMDFIR